MASGAGPVPFTAPEELVTFHFQDGNLLHRLHSLAHLRKEFSETIDFRNKQLPLDSSVTGILLCICSEGDDGSIRRTGNNVENVSAGLASE